MRAVRDHGRPLARVTGLAWMTVLLPTTPTPSTGLVDTAIPGAARCGRNLQLLGDMLVLAPQAM
jgi:hypothetical protein